jgi:hypothetical protein
VQGKTVVHSFTADSETRTLRETCATRSQMLLDRTEGFPQIIGIVAETIQSPYESEARCHVWVESRCAEITVPEGTKTFARNMQ